MQEQLPRYIHRGSKRTEKLSPFITLSGVDAEEAKKCMDKKKSDQNTTAFVEGDALVIDLGGRTYHYFIPLSSRPERI